MEFSYFDIIISILVLFLGLKGIINGFFKELFGLIGIIGGIFLASRIGDDVGKFINNTILKFENDAAISFTGFLVTLALFWLFMIMVGAIFKRLSSLSGLGIFDKILGFVFSASKFFLIAAVIAYAAYNVKAMKPNLDSIMKNSIIFPVLVETGSVIMKIDPIEIPSDINNTLNKSSEAVSDGIDKALEGTAQKIVEETKNVLGQSAEQNISNEKAK
ncbi:MAG: rane protein required for colicin production [Campylobacterota bacterium]|nr:rane protein required for colicin production [Campylobacterota bacterium]MDQ1338729.1 rane protein required for colicin production [Campylobacterota bacterium]